MLLKKVSEELFKVRGQKSLFSELPYKEYNALLHFTKQASSETLFRRPLSTYTRLAKLLDVPPSFIISIVKMEDIDDE